MDFPSLLLTLALALIVAAFVMRPFVGLPPRARPRDETADDSSTDLLIERERLLNALQELDFDHALGKIADEDYAPQRAALVAEGVKVLKALDRLGPSARDGRDEIEDRVRQARRGAEAVEVEIEAAVAAYRQRAGEPRSSPDGFACRHCGHPRNPGDRFCGRCGTAHELHGEPG